MNLIRFLWSASESRTLTVMVLTVLNGISGGILLVLLPDAALNIFSTHRYLFYAVSLPAAAGSFLLTRHLARKKTDALAEHTVENMTLSITNTIRHRELPEVERFDRSDILLGIANAHTISTGAGKNIESVQAYITLFIGWGYIFFFLSYVAGLAILFARLFQIMIEELFEKIFHKFIREQMEEEKEMFGAFRNHLYGFKELKFSRNKDRDIFDNHLLPHVENSKKIRIKISRYAAELNIITILIHMLAVVFIIVFATSCSSEEIMKIVIILFFAMQNDMLIVSSLQDIARANAALERINRLFPAESLKNADEDILLSRPGTGAGFHSLCLENISFTYPQSNGNAFSVHIRELNIRAGEICFIIGGNGSGKSTLMKILTGMYPPDRGVIKMDGQPVSLSEHREMITGVFSDFHLFDRLYGLETVDEQRLMDLLKLTELSGKTAYDPAAGFTTLDLSTGQRKRLALVSAMMEDKAVFVFDEWAADQDPHFRHYFYETILPGLKEKGKTVIAITHDDRYFHIADTVIQMEYGEIKEQWHPDREKRVDSFLFDKPAPPLSFGKDQFQEMGKTEKSAKPDKKDSRKTRMDHLRQIFKEEQNSVKKILFLMSVFAMCFVGLTIAVIHMPMQNTIGAVWYIWFIFLLILMVIVFRRFQMAFYQVVEKRIAVLRINVMNQVRKTDLLTLKKVGEGKIYSTLTSDIKSIADTSNILMVCILGVVRTFLIYLYIGYLYLPLLVMMLFLTGIGFVLYMSNHIKMVKLSEAVGNQERKLFASVTHLLEGFKDLKLDSRKSNDFYHKNLRLCVSGLRELKLRAVRYYVNNATITYGFWLGMLLTMVLVMPFAGMPPEILPIAVALVFTMPLRQIIDRYAQFHMAYLSIERLFEFENTMKNLAEESAGTKVPDRFENIRYENISFTYQTEKDSLAFSIGPMGFSFKAGEIVFITGGNGSGKTTLLNIITGLYPADTGQIFVNNGENTDIQSYRELFSPIFADFHLFDRLYGMDKIDETKLGSLLKLFELEKRVTYTDGKFSTLDLSTGQKKRLSMLVTLMEDKPVYVFDEWAADQDPHFREYYYKTLLPECRAQGKTVIAVTHDDRYFDAADRILHLEYGRLTHTGNP